MRTSRQALLHDAKKQGYKPENLDKVYRLLDTFQQLMSVPFLKERLVLKGGTALNLFCFDSIPRLSVDIDLNYIGALDRGIMLKEKDILHEAISQVLQQNQFERYRSPNHHAGGKMVWFYNSVLGQRGTLEIDINYLYRQPLWPINYRKPHIAGYENWQAPVLDIHEIAAGKLSALFDRRVSRDLFDAHYLMGKTEFDREKLRLAFTVYLAMTNIDLNILKPETIQYDLADLKNRLLPVLHQHELPHARPALQTWATKLLEELRQRLATLLPLQPHQIDFINHIRHTGEIKPELITDDTTLAEKIKRQPALHWALQRHKFKN